MESLERLETCIDELLAKFDLLQAENARLQEELASMDRNRALLEEENRNLHGALSHAEGQRLEALKRIDLLLRKIQDHDRVE